MPKFDNWWPTSKFGSEYVNVKAFGAIGDGNQNLLSTLYASAGSTDAARLAAAQVDYPKATSLSDSADWCAIQAALDYALEHYIQNVVIPDGMYYTSDTLHCGYGWRASVGAFHTVVLNGIGYGTAGPPLTGTWIRPLFKNRPVINIQGGRKSGVRGLGIWGTTEITVPASLNGRADASNYVPSGAQDTVASPFCGVCIDGYGNFSGITVPPTPYPTPRYPAWVGTPPMAYGAGQTSDFFVDDCFIQHTLIGICVHPYTDGNGDFGKFRNTEIKYQKVAFSITNSQARNTDCSHCIVFGCHTVFDAETYGAHTGNLGGVSNNLVIGLCYRLIHGVGGWSQPIIFNHFYAEDFLTIGDMDGVKITFDSCTVNTNDWVSAAPPVVTEWRQEPFFYGQATFRNCNFNYRAIYHFEGRSTFHNCIFNGPTVELNYPGGMEKAVAAFGRVFITTGETVRVGPTPITGVNYMWSRRPAMGSDQIWASDGYNGLEGQNLWSVGQKGTHYTVDYDHKPMSRYQIVNTSGGTVSGNTTSGVSSSDVAQRHEVGDVLYSSGYAMWSVSAVGAGPGYVLTLKALTTFKMEGGVFSMLTLTWAGGLTTNYGTLNTYVYFPIGTLDLNAYTASANGVFFKTTAASPTVEIVDCDGTAVIRPAEITLTSKPLWSGVSAKVVANTLPFPPHTYISALPSSPGNTITMTQNALVSGTWLYGPGIKRLK